MCCVTHLVLMCSNKTVSTPLVLRKKNGFGGLVFLFFSEPKDKSDTRSVAFNEVESSDSEPKDKSDGLLVKPQIKVVNLF